MRSLKPLTNSADASQCKEIALALEALDAKEPPLTETLEQEKVYAERSPASEPKLNSGRHRAIQAKMLAPMLERSTGHFQTNQFNLRQTMVAFAARAYELEKSSLPRVSAT